MGVREEIADELWQHLGNDVAEDVQTRLLMRILGIVEKYMEY
jgi:hypothetical protein